MGVAEGVGEDVGESVGDGLGLAVGVAEGSAGAGVATGGGVRLSSITAGAEKVASGGETVDAPEHAAGIKESKRMNPIVRIFMGLHFQSIGKASWAGPAEGGSGLL